MNIHNIIKNHTFKSYPNRNLSSSKDSFQKSIQVCILGGHTPTGRIASFLMKQNPIISNLRIQGDKIIRNLAADLSHIDTICGVQAYVGATEVPKAVTAADVILILGNENLNENTTLADRVFTEGRRVYDIAKECTLTAPRSIIIVCVPPISVMTPLVAKVFKETYWYHPGRIIGSAAVAQMKANSLVGRYHDLNPFICQVPIIGGPDIDLAVPLFSRAKPVELNDKTAQGLMAKFRGLREVDFPQKICRKDFVENCPLGEGFALNNMLTNVALGICGDNKAHNNAFIRSNAVGTCQHLVTTLRFSRCGVVHNHGVPQLTKLELEMFERAVLEIQKREQIAAEMFEFLEGKCEVPPFRAKDLDTKRILQQTVIRI
ncbi:hypothetical protein JTB14_028874 [Gonioctena quinquepunctata]|nr:hypothetical protein JTB14_028874 [Gonioctena quinquepunctata]